MPIFPPDWLTRHGGELRTSIDGISTVVLFDHKPQYLLKPIPAVGKYSCEIMQLNNGKRLPNNGIYSSPEEATQGGLEELRKALGW